MLSLTEYVIPLEGAIKEPVVLNNTITSLFREFLVHEIVFLHELLLTAVTLIGSAIFGVIAFALTPVE